MFEDLIQDKRSPIRGGHDRFMCPDCNSEVNEHLNGNSINGVCGQYSCTNCGWSEYWSRKAKINHNLDPNDPDYIYDYEELEWGYEGWEFIIHG